ncbi:MAG: ACP synthase [Paraburkholderia fungorum]|nr:ACP synthase [Paraburkholderia fungorum]
MSHRKRTASEFKHPSTFTEIVAFANERHAERMSRLKAAETLIRAVEPDLRFLLDTGRPFVVDSDSFERAEWHHGVEPGAPKKRALRIAGSVFEGSNDRVLAGFIERGWLVECVHAEKYLSKALLRRPKTKTRVILNCSLAFASQLLVQSTTEAQ